MLRPVLGICPTCKVVFDVGRAPPCGEDHPGLNGGQCRVCPLGHALHDYPAWQRFARRDANDNERRFGLATVLKNYVLEAP